MDGWVACMKEPLVDKAFADPTKRSPQSLCRLCCEVRRRLDPVPLRDGVVGDVGSLFLRLCVEFSIVACSAWSLRLG